MERAVLRLMDQEHIIECVWTLHLDFTFELSPLLHTTLCASFYLLRTHNYFKAPNS